jgi:hypothetical protein
MLGARLMLRTLVSAEPLLGALDLWNYFRSEHSRYDLPALDWVIAGGESGPGARLTDVAWLRSLRDQCNAAGVPFFLKQLGARPFQTPFGEGFLPGGAGLVPLKTKKGGDPAEWPEDLRNARAFPEVRL